MTQKSSASSHVRETRAVTLFCGARHMPRRESPRTRQERPVVPDDRACSEAAWLMWRARGRGRLSIADRRNPQRSGGGVRRHPAGISDGPRFSAGEAATFKRPRPRPIPRGPNRTVHWSRVVSEGSNRKGCRYERSHTARPGQGENGVAGSLTRSRCSSRVRAPSSLSAAGASAPRRPFPGLVLFACDAMGGRRHRVSFEIFAGCRGPERRRPGCRPRERGCDLSAPASTGRQLFFALT